MSSPPHLIGLDDEIITSSEAQQMEDDASYSRSLLGPQASHRAVREMGTDVLITTRNRSPEAINNRWQGASDNRRVRVLDDEDVPMEPCTRPAVVMPPPAAGAYVPHVTQPLEAETQLSRGRGRGA